MADRRSPSEQSNRSAHWLSAIGDRRLAIGDWLSAIGDCAEGAHLPRRGVPGLQQRTNTSCYLAIPTRGFTAVVSVFGGTPPVKPLNCKIRLARSDTAAGTSRAHHAGECRRTATTLVVFKITLSSDDITWMSFCFCSQIVHLVLAFVHADHTAGRTKNPAYLSVSRVRKISIRSSEPAYTGCIQTTFGSLPDPRHGESRAKRMTRVRPAMTCRFRDRRRRPTRG